jgi:hypothetical protein
MTAEQPSISPQMHEALNAEIEPDEHLLWAGTTNVPGRMRRLRPLVITSVFMLFLCSFVFWNNPSRWVLVLLSVLIWAGIPAFVYWRQSAHLRNTLYAVTDRRALILSVGNPKGTQSFPPERIEFVQPMLKKSGRGDIYFAFLEGAGQAGERYKHGFLDIENAEYIAGLMRDVLLGQSADNT